MVWIPAGEFIAGDPRRKLRCEGFFLARHPVTNEQYQRFVDETNYWHGSSNADFLRHWRDGSAVGKEQHPVVWVAYIDALFYCRWAGLTLPSQWH